MRTLTPFRRAPLPREIVRLRRLGAGPQLGPDAQLPPVATDPVYPNWQQSSPPDGSYKKSCRKISVDGNGNLYAECDDGTGKYIPSNLYYGACVSAPYNANGILGCGLASGAQQSGPGAPPVGIIPLPIEIPPVISPPVPVQINPATGQPVAPIPPNGPLPPGQGYQQVEAPGNPYPYVYIGQGNAPAPGSVYVIGQIPPGSYQQTSSNVRVDQNGYLYATCQRIDGSWVQSPPLYYLNCTGDISNQNGVLTCGSGPITASPYGAASPFPYGYPTYPSTAATNVPLPGGGVANPATPVLSSSGIGSQISGFFSQYGGYIALGLAGVVAIRLLRGGRR